MARLNILIVDDDPAAAALAARELHVAGLEFDARRVDTEHGYREALHQSTDTILCSERVPDLGGLRALDILHEEGIDIPVIVLARTRGEDAAVDAMKHGAADYLLEERIARLPTVVLAAIERARLSNRKAGDPLRERDDRFRSLADVVPACIRVSDDNGNCTHVNQGWLDFTGRSRGEELGSGWAEGLHPGDREQTMAEYAERLAQRRPSRSMFRLRRHDGEHRLILDSGAPQFLTDGTFVGFVDACVDITDCARPVPVERRNVRPASAGAGSASFPAGSEVILVVEDEPAVRMLANNLLKRCGYTVVVAETAQQALEICRTHSPGIDLVVTDMVLPDIMNGLELATRLRRQQAGLPVILITGYGFELSRDSVAPKGLAFLQKPFKTSRLAQMVRAALDAREEKAQ